jgi:Cu(I)/Ag(I) efflux system protein CusF
MLKPLTLTLALISLGSAAMAQASSGKAEGEIRKIDKEAGKITIKHGPIEAMEMPGMTMVFRVSDPTLLDKLKVGEAIVFTAAKQNGAYFVTAAKAKK